ncbi:MAG: TmcC family electron transfer complex membrane anchor subunit [Desulfovibrionaceae bacterium]
MHGIYNFITGPLCWFAFIVFFGGLIAKFVSLYNLTRQKDQMVFSYLSFGFALRSIIMWLIPYVPVNARRHPVMFGVTYVFHVCLLVAPVFLAAHVMMLKDGVGLSWATVSDSTADVMTMLIIASLVFFAVRRMVLPEAKYVTSAKEYGLLLLVAAPFVTGFLAYNQIFDYQVMIILHILSGELMLIAIPFTWLAHMILAPMVRAYMGSEFGAVRHAKDW